jgi:hypothetical protein
MMEQCIVVTGYPYVEVENIAGNVIWCVKRKMSVFSFITMLKSSDVHRVVFAFT